MKPLALLRDSARTLKNTRTLVVCAMLLALQVTLGMLISIPVTPYVRISVGYLAPAAVGALFGPIPALLVDGLADVITYFVTPARQTGAYFPGYTLSAMLSGMTYGFLFYKRDIRLLHVLIARLIVGVFISLGLNTLWTSLLMGRAFMALLPLRAIRMVMQYPVDVILMLPFIALVRRQMGERYRVATIKLRAWPPMAPALARLAALSSAARRALCRARGKG